MTPVLLPDPVASFGRGARKQPRAGLINRSRAKQSRADTDSAQTREGSRVLQLPSGAVRKNQELSQGKEEKSASPAWIEDVPMTRSAVSYARLLGRREMDQNGRGWLKWFR